MALPASVCDSTEWMPCVIGKYTEVLKQRKINGIDALYGGAKLSFCRAENWTHCAFRVLLKLKKI